MEELKNFFLKNTSAKQTVTKNVFWLFSSEIISRFLKIILVIYAARILGAGGWGIFSYAISIGALLMTFSDLGIGNLITREASQKKEGYKPFISAAFFIKGIVLSVSVLLVIFLSPLISHVPEAVMLFPAVAILLFFDSLRNLGFSINRAFEKMEREVIVMIITNVIILALGVFMLAVKPVPKSLAVAYALGSAAGFVAIFIIIKKEVAGLWSPIDWELIKTVFRTTLPLIFITLIGSIMSNVDIYMLGIWKTPGDIGLYAAAQRAQQFILIFPSMIATATFPLFSRLANTDREKSREVLEKTLSFTMLIGIPVAVGGAILSGNIISLAFGQEYIASIPVLRIFMIMLLVSFPLILLSNAIFAYDRQKETAFAYMSGVMANVLLNFILIPRLGAEGAALATLTSTAIITLLIWKKMKEVNYFKILPKLKNILAASAVMACSVVLFRYIGINAIINTVVSSFVYFGMLFLLKEQTVRDIREIIRGGLNGGGILG